MASGNDLAKFGCYVTRWKDSKDGSRESWNEHLAFRAPAGAEHTDAAWVAAKVVAAKKWKQTTRSGWEVNELWMEPPCCL